MGVFKGVYDLQQEGSRDSARHQDKLKEAFRKSLKDIISKENIITDDSGKKVKVPIRSLDQYRFIFDQKKIRQTGQGNGKTQKGDIIGQEPRPGENGPGAGDEEGSEDYEAEIGLDDLVEMMLEDLGLPKLDPKKKADITVPEYKWTDVSKRGTMGNLHKKRTMIENIKRNAMKTGEAKFKNVNEDDLRFKSYRIELKPITSAVVFAAMDVSGSMTEDKKYIARSFFFWMTQFLKHKYENVEIVFIAHTTTAKEVSEQDFFHTVESGGTICSSAYLKIEDIIKVRYDPAQWNIFAFHFSDGDTFGDEQECIDAIHRLCSVCNMVGYGEINIWDWQGYYSTLYKHYEQIIDPKFVQAMIKSKDDVWPTLHQFFGDQLEDKDNG